MNYRDFEILDTLKKAQDFEKHLGDFDNKQSGAMVVFIGRVRNHNNNKKVTSLSYQAYDDMAQKVGEEILKLTQDKFDILGIKAYHRSGTLDIADNAIKIYAISKHRKNAFLACEFCIDEIKKALPIWKKESYENEDSKWVFCKEHNH